jgi:hypothetical protein
MSTQQRNWTDRLLDVSREAFDDAAYTAAYHTLFAAMHTAISTEPGRLPDVEREATRQRDDLLRRSGSPLGVEETNYDMLISACREVASGTTPPATGAGSSEEAEKARRERFRP